ncbi:MAG TPA: hypothetical protein VJR91_09215 [Burkholderia sp.]|nr:hypothetical protein [Burkholderia cepacia]HKT63744.1 hypothetical protein [Burkholderia sp.]
MYAVVRTIGASAARLPTACERHAAQTKRRARSTHTSEASATLRAKARGFAPIEQQNIRSPYRFVEPHYARRRAAGAFFHSATKERLMGISIGISMPQNAFAANGVTALNNQSLQNDGTSAANGNTQALDQMLAMLIMMMLQHSAMSDGSSDDSGLSGSNPGFGLNNGIGPAMQNGSSQGSQSITQELMQILMQLMMNQMQSGSTGGGMMS